MVPRTSTRAGEESEEPNDDAAWIERYAAAYRKVALQAASVKKHFAEAN